MSESTGGSPNRTHLSQADEALRQARTADDRSEADRATFAAASHVRPGVALKPINQVYPRAKRQVLANRGH